MFNPLQSRRFWTMLVDMVVSVALFFSAKYLPANSTEDIKFLIITLQPVALFLIAGYTVEDSFLARYTAPKNAS